MSETAYVIATQQVAQTWGRTGEMALKVFKHRAPRIVERWRCVETGESRWQELPIIYADDAE